MARRDHNDTRRYASGSSRAGGRRDHRYRRPSSRRPFPEAYWKNIVDKRRRDHRDPARALGLAALLTTPIAKARDRIYSKWGGFIDEVPFDPHALRNPAQLAAVNRPLQLLALEVVRACARRRRAIPIGRSIASEQPWSFWASGGGLGDVGLQYACPRRAPACWTKRLRESRGERLPEWTEDSFPGILLNVAAGRVANRFDFGGANFTVDAACASSLAAVDLAVRELESGRSDLVDRRRRRHGAEPVRVPVLQQDAGVVAARPLPAPSTTPPTASSSARASASLVLKRLADAERDGDRIYAVIKAVGSSSDGRAQGLTAPRPDGQMRALASARTRQAGFSPATIGLVEAHGTGTAGRRSRGSGDAHRDACRTTAPHRRPARSDR